MILLFEISNNVTTIIVGLLVFIPSLLSFLTFLIARKVKKQTDGLVEKLIVEKDATIAGKETISALKGKAAGMAEKQIEVDQLNKDSQPENK